MTWQQVVYEVGTCFGVAFGIVGVAWAIAWGKKK